MQTLNSVWSADASPEYLDQATGASDGHSQAAHTSLTELKQSILQKAFAGELISLPEKEIEEAVA